MDVQVTGFRQLHKHSLRGLATIRLPALALEIREIAIHKQGDASWVGLPARAQLDSIGYVIRNAAGKVEYSAVLQIFDPDIRAEFSRSVIAALLKVEPGALDNGESAA
jgi:hypothetical protein